jgi:hypothetical protein
VLAESTVAEVSTVSAVSTVPAPTAVALSTAESKVKVCARIAYSVNDRNTQQSIYDGFLRTLLVQESDTTEVRAAAQPSSAQVRQACLSVCTILQYSPSTVKVYRFRLQVAPIERIVGSKDGVARVGIIEYALLIHGAHNRLTRNAYGYTPPHVHSPNKLLDSQKRCASWVLYLYMQVLNLKSTQEVWGCVPCTRVFCT